MLSGPMSKDRRLFIALSVLTFATGLVDAASVLGLGHVFTANMTGNIVFLGFAFAGAGRAPITESLLALAGFLAGAVAGGRINRAAVRLRSSVACEAVAIAAAAVAVALLGDRGSRGLAVVLMAWAMGLQNAAVRRLGVPDMTTTVLTLTMTGLAADSRLAGGDAPRTGRRLASVALMLAGALAGAWWMRRGVKWVILGAATLVSVAWAVVE